MQSWEGMGIYGSKSYEINFQLMWFQSRICPCFKRCRVLTTDFLAFWEYCDLNHLPHWLFLLLVQDLAFVSDKSKASSFQIRCQCILFFILVGLSFKKKCSLLLFQWCLGKFHGMTVFEQQIYTCFILLSFLYILLFRYDACVTCKIQDTCIICKD